MKKFIKKHRRGLKAILYVGGLFTLFLILRGLGIAERGNNALGGEITVFLLPLIIVAAKQSIEDMLL